MRSKFRLEMDVVLNTEVAANVIETARQCSVGERRVSSVSKGGAAGTIPTVQLIDGIEDALMHLLEHNPLLAENDVEVEAVGCGSVSVADNGRSAVEDAEPPARATARPDEPAETGDTEDDLDEFETGVYLCRWPNGDFSIVRAEDRKTAVVQLDEWAGAEPAWLTPMDACMIDFRLSDKGEIELAEFGEETADFIWDTCYPELERVLSSDDVLKHLEGKHDRKAAKQISRAVEHERKRLWHVRKERTPAKTAIGRELQKRLGTVGPVADHYVQVAAAKILRTKGGEKGKPS